MDTLSLYYFMKAEHLFSNLRKDRIKLSVPEGCNDPLEFTPWQEGSVTSGAEESAASVDSDLGFVSFSRDYSNSAMWGHYADAHKGVCLQFDIPILHVSESAGNGKRRQSEQYFLIEDPVGENQYLSSIKNKSKYYPIICKIKYDLYRPKGTLNVVVDSSNGDDVCVRVTRPYTQKSCDWQYEQEYRLFAVLSRCEYDEGHYFLHGLNKHLKRIILGTKCSLTEAEIKQELARMGEAGEPLKSKSDFIQKADYSPKYYSLIKKEKKNDIIPEPSVSIILNQENACYLASLLSQENVPPSLRDFVVILRKTIKEQKIIEEQA